VNALSEWLIAEVRRDGKVHRQEFARGVRDRCGDRRLRHRTPAPPSPSSQTPRFSKSSSTPRRRWCSDSARRAFLNPRPEDRPDRRARGRGALRASTTRAASRISSTSINEAKEPVHKHIVYYEGGDERGTVEVAMQWNNSYVESVFSFANNINTHEGGAHLTRLQERADRDPEQSTRARRACSRRRRATSKVRDMREGLAAVISVKLRDSAVRGADEDQARQPLVEGMVKQTVNQKLAEFLEENPTDARQIVQKTHLGLTRTPGCPQGA